MVDVKIKIIAGGRLPEFKTEGAVCADCYARLDEIIPLEIASGKRTKIPLGFAIELPVGYEAVIRPRSGLSSEKIDCVIGTIDSDYRGEVMANIVNNDEMPFFVNNGDRICQMAIREAPKVRFTVVDKLSDTTRGTGGFGSTGKKN